MHQVTRIFSVRVILTALNPSTYAFLTIVVLGSRVKLRVSFFVRVFPVAVHASTYNVFISAGRSCGCLRNRLLELRAFYDCGSFVQRFAFKSPLIHYCGSLLQRFTLEFIIHDQQGHFSYRSPGKRPQSTAASPAFPRPPHARKSLGGPRPAASIAVFAAFREFLMRSFLFFCAVRKVLRRIALGTPRARDIQALQVLRIL